MLRILRFFFPFLLLCPFLAYGQDAVLSGGGDASGLAGSSNYSIGQVAYIQTTNGASSFYQGVQQPTTTVTNTIVYVDHTASGTNDGKSWTDAFIDLQDALAYGTDISIYIAQGIYKPTSGTQRGVSFEILEGQKIYGGFPNGGGDRNPDANLTILSGEIDNVAGYDGNSFHVVKVVNSPNVIIDGLDIKDGNANNAATFGRARGGGIFCNNSTLLLRNVVLRRNQAIYGGGMFATLSPNVTIQESEIKLNQSDYGSALYHSNETMMYIRQSRIIDNNSLIRCAIEINNSLYTSIENSLIANNASKNANAIGYIATNRDQSCDIVNTTILGETKNKYLLTIQVGFGDQLDLNIQNSIIAHQNPAFSKNVVAFNNNILNFIHHNCYVQGSSIIGIGTNTLYSDIDGALMLNPDYSVDECSPVVDAGDNAFAAGLFDIDGNIRLFNTVDIGAYEAQTLCTPPREMGEVSPINLTEIEFEEIKIYPNPTSGFLNIKSPLEDMTVHIFDTSGKKLSSTTRKYIDISELPTGNYFIQIEWDGTLLKTEKIIKN